MKNLIMLVYIAIVSQVHGEIPSSISCTLNQCYTAFESATDFQTALDLCKKTEGHLMTVRSSASNEAMRELFTIIKGEFWIGLKFSGKDCTDTSELKGYEWITGDTRTDFTNWSNRNSESLCDPTCVSVSRDLKWKERPCHDNLDGFLCENSFDYICNAPDPGTSESVVYNTPFGNEGEGAISLPPGSLVTLKPSGNKYICAPYQGWLSAPWPCEVLKGGCEHECVMNGNPQCTCPTGEALQDNGVMCASTPNDSCVNLGCEQICLPSKGLCLCRGGYELLEDGKGCRDVDECRDEIICPISKCVNTIGSYECKCPDGFTGEDGFCVDIDECVSSPCEHECKNTEGSYTCSCFEGHIQSPDDPTKCKLLCDKQKCPANCDINKPTECQCPPGFIVDIAPKDIPMCIDIDECAINFCSHGCNNTFGSYICLCPVGFTLVEHGECEKEESGSTAPPSPLDTVTPTSKDTTEVTTAITPGGLLGITVCIIFIVLIIVFLVHQMSRRRSS